MPGHNTDSGWRPNVLLVMADRFNERCISPYGHPDVKTPVIDSLVEGGVSFRNTFCQCAICQPSRVSFFSGQYAHTHGIEHNCRHASPKGEVSPLPALLRDTAGYRTGAFGKIHLGAWSDSVGFGTLESSCDTTIGEPTDPGRECEYYQYLRCHGLFEEYRRTALEPPRGLLEKMHYGVSGLPAEHSVEAWTVDRTMNFIDSCTDTPFFAWCSFLRPHNPHTPPRDAPEHYDYSRLTVPPFDPLHFESKPRYTSRPTVETLWRASAIGEEHLRRALAGYYGLISLIDHSIGRLLAHLRETGRLEDTIVVFTADHGCLAGKQKRRVTVARGARDQQGFREGGNREPLFRQAGLERPAPAIHANDNVGVSGRVESGRRGHIEPVPCQCLGEPCYRVLCRGRQSPVNHEPHRARTCAVEHLAGGADDESSARGERQRGHTEAHRWKSHGVAIGGSGPRRIPDPPGRL